MGIEKGSGVQQWIFQRFSNIVILVFLAVLVTAVLSGLSYESLTGLFAKTWFKIYLTFTLFFASMNSILAGWQIAGDYAHKVSLPSWTLTGLGIVITLVYLLVGLMLIF